MKKLRAVPAIAGTSVDTESIPAHVSMNLAQVALAAILRDYQRPEVQVDYQRWKAERAAKEAMASGQ